MTLFLLVERGEVFLLAALDRRGTDLAGRLIDLVVGWTTGRGRWTCLLVKDDNVGAIRAYRRAGFVDHGVPDDWPADAPPERRMWHSSAVDTSPQA